MKLYSITVKLAATAYIKADSEEEAWDILHERVGDGTNGAHMEDDVTLVIDGSDFHPSMEEFTLSPAITYYGHYEDEDLELVEEFEEDEETDGEEE